MSTNNNNNTLGTIGNFTAPVRPENAEKRGKGRPKGSVNAKMPLTLAGDNFEKLVTANGRFVWDKTDAQWKLNGIVRAASIEALKEIAAEIETIEKLPPVFIETLGKYTALIFGSDLSKIEAEEAEALIETFYCSNEAYNAWLRAKTGEIAPKHDKIASEEDKAQAKLSLLAKLRK